MADLSNLSDEELMALAAQREQTRRSVASMTDDELRAAAYVQPKPPPGVTIHTKDGSVFIDRNGKPVKTTMAEARARAGRETGGIAGDVAGSVLRGVPYAGEFLPRANAALSGGDYAQNLEREQAKAKTFDADYPVASLAGKATGAVAVTAAALPLMKAGGVVGGAANLLFGGGASTALGAMGRGAVAGGLQGAAQGVGQSEDLTNAPDVARNAAVSGGFGAALGGGIPGAISLAGHGRNMLTRSLYPDALSSVPRPAAAWAEKQFSDPVRLSQMQRDMQALGPDGMLADVSPEMAQIARGAAALPGTRDRVVNVLTARDAGKNARIGQAVDANFGPAPVPSRIEAGIREGQEALGPIYGDAFQNAARVDTTALANTLDASVANLRGPAQRRVQEVRRMLDIPGTDQLDPNPSALFQTRQAIDGILATEQNPQAIRQLTMARQQVDRELARAVPGVKDVDAQFQELARQREALQRGGQVLDSGKTATRPTELAQEITEAAQPAGNLVGPSASPVRLREGARAEIERIIGTNANDVAKLNQVLKSEGDWNRDKLRLLFGQDRADAVLRVLDAERRMEGTFRKVVGNSETAATNEFARFLKEAGTPARIDPSASLFGTMVSLGKRAADKVSGSNAEAQAQRFAEALSEIPVAQQARASALIQALMTRAQRSQNTAGLNNAAGLSGPQLSAIVRALMGDSSDPSDRRTLPAR
jgi:hypothetical protein